MYIDAEKLFDGSQIAKDKLGGEMLIDPVDFVNRFGDGKSIVNINGSTGGRTRRIV